MYCNRCWINTCFVEPKTRSWKIHRTADNTMSVFAQYEIIKTACMKFIQEIMLTMKYSMSHCKTLNSCASNQTVKEQNRQTVCKRRENANPKQYINEMCVCILSFCFSILILSSVSFKSHLCSLLQDKQYCPKAKSVEKHSLIESEYFTFYSDRLLL